MHQGSISQQHFNFGQNLSLLDDEEEKDEVMSLKGDLR